jgi:uncharacterized protein with HEPN domain
VNKHEFRAKDYLLHMLEAADRVLEYTAGVTEEQFVANQMLQDAVVRNIEIIGEAANNLLEVGPEFAARYPSIPFARIYGMRNRVAHGYFAVSTAMIWDSVQVDVPELRGQIAKVLDELQTQDSR